MSIEIILRSDNHIEITIGTNTYIRPKKLQHVYAKFIDNEMVYTLWNGVKISQDDYDKLALLSDSATEIMDEHEPVSSI